MPDEKKESGGFLRGLKNLVLEEEPDTERQSSAEAGTATERPIPTQRLTPSSPPVPSNGGTPDPKVRALLDKYVQEAALPAFSAFNDTLTKLQDVIPDEGTRIKAALKTLPDGAGLSAVLTDIDECIQALDDKERAASQAAEKAIAERVGAKEAEVAAVRGDIEAKKAQIADLQKEIVQLEASASTAQTEIASERREIEETQRRFSATVAAYRAEIGKTKQKITQYGKGA